MIKFLLSFMQRYNGHHYVTLYIQNCKLIVVYRFYCMALYHSHRRHHVINSVLSHLFIDNLTSLPRNSINQV